ncbi:MAG: ethanolamine ammonia-lyase reactivating factor EutA [Caulobacteraceae bacterium]
MAHDAPWEHHHDVGEKIGGHDDSVVWTTVGFDVGSSTSQVVFSRITLSRDDAQYVVTERTVLHESEVILTPYASSEVIDGAALAAFVERQYTAAHLTPADVDTGAVILTGLALSTGNARAIAEAVADDSGRFVAVAAGDVLEARLAASGAGAQAASQHVDGVLVHIDIGGGTTKLSAWRNGHLLGVAAIDVGARLITFDADRRVKRVVEAAERMAAGLNLTVPVGEPFDPAVEARLTGAMARDVLRYAGVLPGPPRGPDILRTDPLFAGEPPAVAAVVVSGGVSEYVYGRETATFGDLGLPLGRAIREEIDKSGVELIPFERGIRATVLGVSQHSVQLSGNTVFVSDDTLLPLRNVPVLLPHMHLDAETLDPARIERAMANVLKAREAKPDDRRLAVAVRWSGSATYARLTVLAEVLAAALTPEIGPADPLIVVLDGDVAGVLGVRLAEVVGASRGVICLDGVHVHEFDHIDIGEFAPRTRALPVVVKSLLFAGSGKTHAPH